MMRALFATEAGGSGTNEDWCAATPNAAIVLDGLSSPATGEAGCKHGTPWYVRNLGSQLVARLANEAEPLAHALAAAIVQVADLHRDTCDLLHPGTPSATVALLRLNGLRAEWEYLVLADSVVVLDLCDGVQAISDHRVEEAAREEKVAIAAYSIGTTEHQLSMDRLIAAQRQVRNRPGGYWVASADPVAAENALTGAGPVRQLRRAALLSDGASRLVDQYARVSWPQLLDLLDEQGPAGLIRQVRAVDVADPLGEQWSRYKVSDDATAIYLPM